MKDSIFSIRTNPELIEKQNWLSNHKWFTVATPHRKTDISELTMGLYQNYCHDEYTFFIDGENIRIHKYTIHNNNASTGGYSKPYIPEEYPIGLNVLFNKLIEITKNK